MKNTNKIVKRLILKPKIFQKFKQTIVILSVFGFFNLQAQDHTTTWIGNSDPTHNGHVMQDIENLYVSPSGKVYCITHWDEGGSNIQVYESDGTLNPKVEESGTGSWGRSSGRAVTGDDTYAYQVFSRNDCCGTGGENDLGGPRNPNSGETWRGVRRYKISTGKGEGFIGGADYDGSVLVINSGGDAMVGLAHYNDELYVADPNDNTIKVYSTNPMTGTLVRSWSVSRPGQLAFDGEGFLWMLQSKNDTDPAHLVRFDANGAIQPQSISFTDDSKIVRGFGIDRVNHKLYICNNGVDQNILIYSNINSSPAFSGTFGNTGGIYSGTPGVHAPLKFEGPSGVGIDNAGNIYVSNRRDANAKHVFGMFLEKYDAVGNRQWVKYALEFSDVADVDPGSEDGDMLDIYTKAERFVMDLSKPAGEDWIWKSSTINFLTYPNDPRKLINHNDLVSSPFVRRINGQKFLFVTNMVTNWLHVYRFEEGSETGIPAAVFAGANWAHFFPYEPTGSDNNRWLWLDKNGDGDFQPDEYDVGATNSGTSIEGWCVDAKGNVFRISIDGTIDEFKIGGIDGNGVPIYSSNNRVTSSITTFNNLKRAEYDIEEDVMFLTGFTDEFDGDEFKSAGRVIARYDNWSSGNRTPEWTISVPFKEQGQRDHMISIAIAGDYIFTVNTWPSTTRIYRKSDGGFERTMDVNNGVEKKGWADLTHSIRAFKRATGEYLVLLEENGAAKIVIYRWCPTLNCSGTCPETSAPSAPSELNVEALSSSEIALNWADSSDNNEGFKIERKIGLAGDYTEIASVVDGVTSYTDTDLAGSTWYGYRVRASNCYGNSPFSNEASDSTQQAPPCNWTYAGGEGAVISFEGTKEVRYGAGSNFFYRTVSNSINCNNGAFGGDPAPGVPKQCDICERGSATIPVAPSNLTATAISRNQINLSWVDESDNEEGFKIERKSEEGSFEEVTMVAANATTYSDKELNASTTYTYRVSAYNYLGSSEYSQEAEAITPSGIVPIGIIVSEAGAEERNNARENAHDGDELTRWANLGKKNKGWIEFVLDGTYELSDIEILFFKGDTRTYPIKIEVDDNEVWAGNTSLSSGFWQQSISGIGSKLRISLTGKNSDRNKWISIYEVKINGVPVEGAIPLPPLAIIIDSEAGAEENNNPKEHAYDKIDSSRWANNGVVGDAWLEFEFDEVYDVKRVEAKFYRGDRRTYPLKIELDGEEVWSGNTRRTATYWKQSVFGEGSKFRLSMTGKNSNRHGWMSIYEIRVYGYPKSFCNWQFAANEWETINTEGTQDVRFGANGSYIVKSVTGSIVCSYLDFGGDPAPGVLKKCEICPGSSNSRMAFEEQEQLIYEELVHESNASLRVYPNPMSEGNLVLDFGKKVTGKLLINDVTGRTLLNRQIDNIDNLEINYASLTKGILILNLEYDNQVISQKLIVK